MRRGAAGSQEQGDGAVQDVVLEGSSKCWLFEVRLRPSNRVAANYSMERHFKNRLLYVNTRWLEAYSKWSARIMLERRLEIRFKTLLYRNPVTNNFMCYFS